MSFLFDFAGEMFQFLTAARDFGPGKEMLKKTCNSLFFNLLRQVDLIKQ